MGVVIDVGTQKLRTNRRFATLRHTQPASYCEPGYSYLAFAYYNYITCVLLTAAWRNCSSPSLAGGTVARLLWPEELQLVFSSRRNCSSYSLAVGTAARLLWPEELQLQSYIRTRLGTGTLPMTFNLYLCANTHAREGGRGTGVRSALYTSTLVHLKSQMPCVSCSSWIVVASSPESDKF